MEELIYQFKKKFIGMHLKEPIQTNTVYGNFINEFKRNYCWASISIELTDTLINEELTKNGTD